MCVCISMLDDSLGTICLFQLESWMLLIFFTLFVVDFISLDDEVTFKIKIYFPEMSSFKLVLCALVEKVHSNYVTGHNLKHFNWKMIENKWENVSSIEWHVYIFPSNDYTFLFLFGEFQFIWLRTKSQFKQINVSKEFRFSD